MEREGKLVEYESYHVWLIIHCRTYPLCSCRLLLFQIPSYALASIWLDRGFVVTCMHSELVNGLIVIKAPACRTRADHHNSELHGLAFRIQSSNWDMHLKSHFPWQFFSPFFFSRNHGTIQGCLVGLLPGSGSSQGVLPNVLLDDPFFSEKNKGAGAEPLWSSPTTHPLGLYNIGVSSCIALVSPPYANHYIVLEGRRSRV